MNEVHTGATHAHGEVRLEVLGPADALAEEFSDFLLVSIPVPTAQSIFGEPLVAKPLHRFVMGRRHHDAVFVCDPLILWIVYEEGCRRVPGPHGWPKEIGLAINND